VSYFFDTNVLIYAYTDGPYQPTATSLLDAGGVISVQVMNEMANVMVRKLRYRWDTIEVILDDVQTMLDNPRPLTFDTHRAAMVLARQHHIPVYDALIVASAQEAGCTTLYTEDMQAGRRFGRLTIVNPFASNL
jgi:predicted nucleic acid-binding protein